MMFNKKISAFGLTSAILFSAASAFAEGDGVEQKQKTLLEKLDSLNAAVLGLKLNGTAKAGGLASMSSSDQYHEDSPTQENQAYSDVNLVITARPSSETQIHLEMRLHKDWQNAYDENNNPLIGHWFSYDGTILNKTLGFNLGYMRVGYTPLTVYTPQQELLQEPEIFASHRVEALAQRNLDTTSRRLMQGLNADFHSGDLGPLSDLHLQATGARMRNGAKKYDQVFFDFDYSDRYFYGLRLGADAFGAHVGVNYTDVFDRQLTTRARLQAGDTVIYEDNSILSIELGFDSKKLLPDMKAVSFGLKGELALSNWEDSQDYLVADTVDLYTSTGVKGNEGIFTYTKPIKKTEMEPYNEELADTNGMAFNVEPYVNLDVAGIKGNIKVMYLQNDENFWSEMASSPVYRGGAVVLNSNALFANSTYTDLVNQFGMSSLENMYFAVYNSNPLNATNLMSSETSSNALSNTEEDGKYLYTRLYNNYKNAHFYRNGYNADVLKRLEKGEALFNMDPSGSLELPYGIATPDRKGIVAKLNLKWNDAVELNAIFSQLTEGASFTGEVDANGALITEENKFTRFAAGLGIDFGRLLDLGRKLEVQGSYDHSEEDANLQRSSDRIIAGATLDVYGPIALLAGFQTVTREFGKSLKISDYASVNKVEESLLLVGPRVKIASNSYLSFQYGLLTDKIQFTQLKEDMDGGASATGAWDNELSIDKNVFVADVTVNF